MKQNKFLLIVKEWLITERGSSLVEVLLSGALLALLVTALSGLLIYGRESTLIAGQRARASYLAEEGLEAARTIRNANYFNLTNGDKGLAVSSGAWSFNGTSDTTDIFSRKITISDAGTNRKQITSTVTWQENTQRVGTVALTSQLSAWNLDPTMSCNDQASFLTVDTSGLTTGGSGQRDLLGITLENINTNCSLIIDKILTTWTDSSNRITAININGTSVWSGSGVSGIDLDITDSSILPVTTVPLTHLRFNKNIKSNTITITFTMSDGTQKLVNNLSI